MILHNSSIVKVRLNFFKPLTSKIPRLRNFRNPIYLLQLTLFYKNGYLLIAF